MTTLIQPDATLLIIDDTLDNVTVLLEFLTNAGFKVLVAQDGEEGIQTVEYARPDLILLDVMMPGIDGFEVCRLLKERPETQEVPVIFITALADTSDKLKGFKVGAADYITKPFQREEVLARVTTHLNLRERTLQLAKRNLELDAFARTVAHDLKNPLSAIIGLTDVVLAKTAINPLLNEKSLEQLKFVAQTGRKTVNIIDALLLLAGVSIKTKVEIEAINMSAMVNQVIQQRLSFMLKQYPNQIILPPSLPMAKGYAPWVEEIWVNYLTNGLKYGGNQLEIGANLADEGESVRFWVKDNGQGLTPEEQAQLFTPFSSLHIKRVEGHGLGLSIVKHIVEKLGGEAGVESRVGQGSLFYFTLPI